ncbi:MAG: tyrosine-type recombinase/integrase, partial [Gemmatimonadetes bacterium]|nr:tyrosine-type recombinase/integrase [Gemmatimonadota bacterium]
ETGSIDAQGRRAEHPQPVGPRAVAKSLKFLRQMMRFATSYRRSDGSYLLQADPTRGLPLPVELDPKRPMMTEQHYQRLLEVADERLRPLLVLAMDTGRRISAILGLRWDDWQPAVGLYGRLRWRAANDKVGRTWEVPVTAAVRNMIGTLPRTSGYLFPSPVNPNAPVTRQRATIWLRAAEERSELEHIPGGGWHMFRRLWATSRKGMSLKDVAYAGGWTDTATLLKLYQQPDEETLQQVVDGGRRELRAVR